MRGPVAFARQRGLTAAMTLEVDGLACRRGGRVVFRDLAFALGAGEALVLRGPNGVGKSTLLRVLAGLVPAEAGRVRLDGAEITGDRDAAAEQIAYGGHLDALKPQLTVAEHLAFWSRLLGGDPARAAAALDLEAIL
ncbi:MAG: ATP-binding cassette domain-containing protein, partial [Pseudomonadota bacterium]